MSLTPTSCSIHVHGTLCDGKDTLEAMAAAAYQQNVQYLGFSCHSHTPIPADEGAVLPADMTEYRQTVLRLRAEYEGRMEILLGLEWDSQSDISPEDFDYQRVAVAVCCDGHHVLDMAAGFALAPKFLAAAAPKAGAALVDGDG